MPPFLFGSLGEYQSAFGKKALTRGIFGWTWGFTAFSINWELGFSKPNHDWYACSDVLILLLGASYILASTHCCLHVYKAFQVQPKASLHFQQIVSHLRLRLPAPEGFLTKVLLLNTFKHFATPTICQVAVVGCYKNSSAVNIRHLPW